MEVLWSTCVLKQAHLDQVAQDCGLMGTFPCHTEHLMRWKRDALESFWQISGEELLPAPLPGAFSALVPFPRTAPPGGCSQHCRKEQAAAATVSTAGKLGPRGPSQALQAQPSPVQTVSRRVVFHPFSQRAELPLKR